MTDTENNGFLEKEDYEEPRCPLCMDTADENGVVVNRIDVGRMMKKLDEYLDYEDYPAAERHLKYWLTEAQYGHDKQGELYIRNEMMGIYRKMQNADMVIENAQIGVKLAEELGLEGTEIYGTTYLNAATGLNFAGKAGESIAYFEKAKAAYEQRLDKNNVKFAGLYNNMALTLVSLGRFDEALDYYEKALSILPPVKNGKLDMASTYLNIASLYEARDGLEAADEIIKENMEKAEACLNDPGLIKDSYYYFVCDKCASGFNYYGYFAFANELEKRVREYHERA